MFTISWVFMIICLDCFLFVILRTSHKGSVEGVSGWIWESGGYGEGEQENGNDTPWCSDCNR